MIDTRTWGILHKTKSMCALFFLGGGQKRTSKINNNWMEVSFRIQEASKNIPIPVGWGRWSLFPIQHCCGCIWSTVSSLGPQYKNDNDLLEWVWCRTTQFLGALPLLGLCRSVRKHLGSVEAESETGSFRNLSALRVRHRLPADL